MKDKAIHYGLLILSKDVMAGALKYPVAFRDYILS
jgi:hypothetical protein